MKKFYRIIENQILKSIHTNKVLLLYGSRRVGKTFLLQSILQKYSGEYQFMNGEDMDVQALFQKRTIANYRALTGNARLLVLDEAQVIPDIGSALKLMIDSQPELTILATGSSSLDLVNKSGEPLTGRNLNFLLFPLAHSELEETILQSRQNLDERLIYGSYPEVFQIKDYPKKADYLRQLVQSYLLKDILAYSGIRHADKIFALLKMVAFQSGSEVSLTELSNQLGISKLTVESYLDLLTKVFVLYKLPAFSGNLRNEITKGSKWFFYDTGIRNAVISNFNPPALRNDMGSLWETYILSERIKRSQYLNNHTQFYFWRTYQQQEIDLIEEVNGQISAFEIKYSTPSRLKIPATFRNRYPEAKLHLITRENYLDYINISDPFSPQESQI
jgi:predicted AAA+ superfamily ATPase